MHLSQNLKFGGKHEGGGGGGGGGILGDMHALPENISGTLHVHTGEPGVGNVEPAGHVFTAVLTGSNASE